MKNRKQILFAGAAAVLLASCGSGGNDTAVAAGEVHACEILPGAEISRIAGGTLIGSNVDVERNSGATAFSQCTHTLGDPHRRVTVQIRRSGTPIDTSRQAGADKERSADDGTGYGIQLAEAMEAGTDIPGLGDVAYTFKMDETLFLVANKDKHVEVRVWTAIESAGNEDALRIVKEIARATLSNL